MKRIIFAILIISCLALSACSDNKNAQIPMEKDAPETATWQEPKGTSKRAMRMIKADGKLYYDSGKVSDIKGRCGTLDGRLTQVGLTYEIPKNDNECNFEGAEGYQNTTSITKEVPIDGKWVIFKLFDDPEQDMSVYDYCFYIKGRMSNAEKDSELVVLTEDESYNFKEFEKMLISRPYNPEEKVYKTTFRAYGDTDQWGITLDARDVTSKGLTLLIEQFGGVPAGELQTGEAFSLEVMKDDKWIPLSTLPNIDYVWPSIAYMIKKNDITELRTNWQWLYGELSPGYYKLKKEISDYRAPGDFDEKVYEWHFTI